MGSLNQTSEPVSRMIQSMIACCGRSMFLRFCVYGTRLYSTQYCPFELGSSIRLSGLGTLLFKLLLGCAAELSSEGMDGGTALGLVCTIGEVRLVPGCAPPVPGAGVLAGNCANRQAGKKTIARKNKSNELVGEQSTLSFMGLTLVSNSVEPLMRSL